MSKLPHRGHGASKRRRPCVDRRESTAAPTVGRGALVPACSTSGPVETTIGTLVATVSGANCTVAGNGGSAHGCVLILAERAGGSPAETLRDGTRTCWPQRRQRNRSTARDADLRASKATSTTQTATNKTTPTTRLGERPKGVQCPSTKRPPPPTISSPTNAPTPARRTSALAPGPSLADTNSTSPHFSQGRPISMEPAPPSCRYPPWMSRT